jgi:hypothetical protein
MNMIPAIGFYWRQHQQLAKLTSHSGALIDMANAVIPVVKKHWPKLNENGLLDDALETLKQMTAEQPNPYPDPTKQ